MQKNLPAAGTKKTLVALLCCACLHAGAAQADVATYPRIRFSTTFKTQILTEDNMDLGQASRDFDDSENIEAKIRATADLAENTTAFSEARADLNYGAGGGEDPITGEPQGRADFLELRQLWLEQRALGGNLPLSVKVGRQRFSENHALWWNRDFDAVRLAYNTTMFNGFVAGGENLASYRTSGEDFLKDQEDITRILGEASWQWQYGQFIEARSAWQNDHSGMESPGTVIDSENRDEEDGDLFWAGLRLAGTAAANAAGLSSGLAYRVDLMGVTGDVDEQQTTAGTKPDTRIVTGSTNNDVRGWALDAGVEIPMPVKKDAKLILGYAYGSGDDDPNDGTDHRFRQTGLQSNASRAGFSDPAFNYYGFALRPELSNLHIFTAGFSSPLFYHSDLTALYHYYRRADNGTDISASGIDAPLSTSSNDVGHALDAMLDVNLGDEFGYKPGGLKNIKWRTTLGLFRAGDAYGNGADEMATRARMELIFQH